MQMKRTIPVLWLPDGCHSGSQIEDLKCRKSLVNVRTVKGFIASMIGLFENSPLCVSSRN